MEYLVIIPTYNEKENIKKIAGEVLKNRLVDLLVVDDNSPDGTARIVKSLLKKGKRLFLLERERKNGLGTAYRDGFSWGLKRGYDYFISMDADFSHPPKSLQKMIEISQKYSQTIISGSRYIRGGKIIGWDRRRFYTSYFANLITRLILGFKVKDSTSGYKCYPGKYLKTLDFSTLVASGYAFLVEMVYLAKEKGWPVLEFPITFTDRRVGQSKIAGELPKSIKIVLRLALRRRIVQQFIRFAIIGATCALIDWAVFFLIKDLTGWQSQDLKQVTKGISFVVSASVSYLLNRSWTFRSSDRVLSNQAIKFFIVATIGLGLNNLLFYFVTGILNLADIWGLVIATGLVTFWNFSANRLWTFRYEKK